MSITAIILTAEQANALRVTYNNIAALEPVAVGDGRYFLPLEVLEDVNFAAVHTELASLPVETIQLPEPAEPEI